MSARRPRPTIDERDAFILKLIAFREKLSPVQQRLLDAMAVAAFCEEPPDVERGYGQRPPVSVRQAADSSPWLKTYEQIPTMME